MFRFVLLCLCISFIVHSDAKKEDVVPELEEACIKEHTLTPEEKTRYDKDLPMETKEGKCFTSCVFQKQIDFFKNGKFEYEVTKEALKRNVPSADVLDIQLRILDSCKDEVKSPEICEAGHQLYLCYIKLRAKS